MESQKALEESKCPYHKEQEQQQILLHKQEQHLTQEQQQVFDTCFQTVKEQCLATIESYKQKLITDAIFLTFLTAQTIKQVEKTILKGQDKKVVALCLAKTLLKEIIENDSTEQKILMLFDVIGEPLIDQIVDVAKNVNVSITTSSASSIDNNTTNTNQQQPKTCCSVM